jgi:hypothetical protein
MIYFKILTTFHYGYYKGKCSLINSIGEVVEVIEFKDVYGFVEEGEALW